MAAKKRATPETAHAGGVTTGGRNAWRNRIVGHEEVDPEQLLGHPKNLRIHPEAQQKAMEGMLDQVGWAGDILVNKRTGTILDGHLRALLALRRDQKLVPVRYVDVDEAEEELILATFDAIGGQAVFDPEKTRDLVNEVIGVASSRHVSALLEEHRAKSEKLLARMAEREEKQGVQQQRTTSVFQLNESALFPVENPDNRWDFPELKLAHLSKQVPHRVWDGVEPVIEREEYIYIYGTSKPPAEARDGVLAFYTDDYRFEVIWNDAVKIGEKFLHAQRWGAVVMPDFSLWTDDPMASQAWNYYRACWCARFWGEVGLKVIPNVNFSGRKETWDWPILTIPHGAPVVATQVRTMHQDSDEGKRDEVGGLSHAIAGIAPQTVLVYGGEYHRNWLEPELPTGPEYVWLPSWTNLRVKKGIAKKKD